MWYFFVLNTQWKYELLDSRVKSDAKYRRDPLFSLAPPRTSALRQPEIRKRGTRESANLRVYDRWIMEARANIVSYGRPEM